MSIMIADSEVGFIDLFTKLHTLFLPASGHSSFLALPDPSEIASQQLLKLPGNFSPFLSFPTKSLQNTKLALSSI
jgi:hypothetical protein